VAQEDALWIFRRQLGSALTNEEKRGRRKRKKGAQRRILSIAFAFKFHQPITLSSIFPRLPPKKRGGEEKEKKKREKGGKGRDRFLLNFLLPPTAEGRKEGRGDPDPSTRPPSDTYPYIYIDYYYVKISTMPSSSKRGEGGEQEEKIKKGPSSEARPPPLSSRHSSLPLSRSCRLNTRKGNRKKKKAERREGVGRTETHESPRQRRRSR